MNKQIQRKKLSASMLLFEFRNITGNPYIHIFGIGLPVLMVLIFGNVLASNIPDGEMLSKAVTGLFLGLGTMIPLAAMLVGYAATFSQELEKGIPQRLELFGIDQGMTIVSRILAELIFQVCSFVIYFAVGALILRIEAPAVKGLFCYMICIAALGVISFGLAHAVALLFRKFGITYCVTMILYFCIMIVSGMMGIDYEMLPPPVQAAARLLPTYYFVKDFADIWQGREYNFIPMLQAYLFAGALAGVLLFFSLRRRAGKNA